MECRSLWGLAGEDRLQLRSFLRRSGHSNLRSACATLEHQQPNMADSSQGRRSPELYIDQQWDRAIDLTVRRVVYGALAGGVAAVLLARESSNLCITSWTPGC